MDITTATPVEIDTELARLDGELHKAEGKLITALASVHYAAGDRKGYRGNRAAWLMSDNEALAKASETAESNAMAHVVESARRALAALDAANTAIAANKAKAAALAAEYNRRPWTRAFLAITNGQGHVHSSMNCSTCNNGQYRTTFGWQPQYSGADEAAIIADAGYRACTVCYPNAPVGDAKTLPTKMFTQDELDAAKAREERAAAKAERDAKKIANALTSDGSELAVPNGRGRYEYFKTERAATTWVVQQLGHHRAYGYSLSQEGVGIVIAALADKHGKSVETVTAEIEAKVAAWIKRNA
jgi:hypothetical protein